MTAHHWERERGGDLTYGPAALATLPLVLSPCGLFSAQVCSALCGTIRFKPDVSMMTCRRRSASVELGSPRVNNESRAQAVHAAGLMARAAAAEPKMSPKSGHSPPALPPATTGTAADTAKPVAPEKPAIAGTEVLHVAKPADKAAGPEGMDLQQVMHIHVKCGDTHVKLGDLLPLMVGAGLGGNLKGALKMVPGASDAAPMHQLQPVKVSPGQSTRLLSPQDDRSPGEPHDSR